MELKDKIVVITGGSGGIGRAMAKAFLAQGAKAIVLADLDAAAVAAAAKEIGCDGQACDVTQESQVQALVKTTVDRHGPIDLFCSNAGAGMPGVLTDAANEVWQKQWDLHVMAHLYAARAVLPGMRARGEGYLLSTASAAGLLTSLPSATYAVSKHAAIALAEWLSVKYGAQGIRVSVLCPQAVDTPMISGRAGSSAARADGVMSIEDVADCVVAGIEREEFLILPHPQVIEYFQRKAGGYDRWLAGMRKFAARLAGGKP